MLGRVLGLPGTDERMQWCSYISSWRRIEGSRPAMTGLHLLLAWAVTGFPSSTNEIYQWGTTLVVTTVVISSLIIVMVGIVWFVQCTSWVLGIFGRNWNRYVRGKKTSELEHEQIVEGIGAHFGGLDSTRDDKNACKIVSHQNRNRKPIQKKTEMNYCMEGVELEKCLLPPRKAGVPADRLTVVLDLDDTLIMTRKTNEIPESVAEAIENGSLTKKESSWNYGQGDTSITIVFRPGIQKFIQKVSEFAEVVLFTAGSASYASPLVDVLDPDQSLFSARLFRCSTVKTRYHEYVKDLSLLGRSLDRVVLMDDRPQSALLQPNNLVPCMPFTGDHRDHQLMASYLPLLEYLQEVPDVRPALKSLFQMETYLIEWGVKESFLKKCLDNPGDTRHSRLR